TEEGEFREIYGMDVITVPTNVPVARADQPDLVYRNIGAKYRAVVKDIKDCYDRGQPVLVGTITIEKSEELSKLLKREGIPHNVLNAKFHEKEAEIVSEAGQRGSVTIATNMAGRGTDIKLGEGVTDLGGLKIIGTERHEARRIDNQLRGRSGRQGDPGESRFYISLEDDLMRLFGSERVMKVVDTMGMDEDEPLENNMLSKAIENAQKKVEGNNFGIRKHLLDYDRVMNEQREIMYSERMKVLTGADLKDNIMTMLRGVLDRAVDLYTGQTDLPEDWDIKALNENLLPIFHKAAVELSKEDTNSLTKESLKDRLYEQAVARYEEREAEFTSERTREIERVLLLRIIDQKWMDHIDDMDQMRQGITLRAYAQRDPIVEYKFLSYEMFDELGHNIQQETVRAMFNVRIAMQPQEELQKMDTKAKQMTTNMQEPTAKGPAKAAHKPGRNEPCHCNSGKKYKHCCALLET
ncbi:MAG: SEC-C metal-binding domain-containing protein, partial [Defluviitaleaceae bacterium]|nr:SEC-C metal-binding domain-containing protein [Defluviitaleaceae bacterium]